MYDFTGEVPLKNHIGNIYNKEGIKDINWLKNGINSVVSDAESETFFFSYSCSYGANIFCCKQGRHRISVDI